MTPQRHAGRTVLVTGAASGIGACISRQYLQEGATVVLIDVNADALVAHAESLSGWGGRTVWATADVADYPQCAQALDRVRAKIGADIDTLINNAGISPKTHGKPANFWEMNPDEWGRVVAVNLHGAFNWSRLVSGDGAQQVWQHREHVLRRRQGVCELHGGPLRHHQGRIDRLDA